MDMMAQRTSLEKNGELLMLIERINGGSERLKSIASSLGRHADLVFGAVPTDISNAVSDGQASPPPLIAQLIIAVERLHTTISLVQEEAERNTRLA